MTAQDNQNIRRMCYPLLLPKLRFVSQISLGITELLFYLPDMPTQGYKIHFTNILIYLG